MRKNITLNSVLLAGLLLSLLFMVGCAPAATGGGGGSPVYLIVILVLMFGMFYFLMVRPMRQREKRHDAMVQELQKGDMVITAGGIYGQVDTVYEDSIILRIESGATIRVTKGGVVRRMEE